MGIKVKPYIGGNGFLQFGLWRIGMVDTHHFSFSHDSGYTSVIYRSDGTIHYGQGQRKDFGLRDRELT